jgi:hypothetical protein
MAKRPHLAARCQARQSPGRNGYCGAIHYSYPTVSLEHDEDRLEFLATVLTLQGNLPGWAIRSSSYDGSVQTR